MTKIRLNNEDFETLRQTLPEDARDNITNTIIVTTWYRGNANKPVEVIRHEPKDQA
jgi:hypothetical protein